MSKAAYFIIGKTVHDIWNWPQTFKFAKPQESLTLEAIADSMPNLSYQRLLDEPQVLPDGPIGLAQVRPDIEDSSMIPIEVAIPVEGLMPLEFPALTVAPDVSAKATEKAFPVALSHKKLPEIPWLAQSKTPQAAASEESSLENLLFVLEESGMKAKEVKQLSPGTTKITLDDLFKKTGVREPELVRVRR